MRILLVEDHKDVADTISDYLIARGHQVEIAADGERGYTLASQGNYEALVLDRILPGMDGATLCSRLRSEAGRHMPVLMLTALGNTSDKLAGFATGADDYMVKPFDLLELEARLIALHRRASGLSSVRCLQVADLTYDPETHVATRDGRPLNLSPSSKRLLEYLLRRGQRVVTKTELEQHLWPDAVPEGDVLPVHMHALRHAIDDGHSHKLLQTVRGVGYRLAPPDGG